MKKYFLSFCLLLAIGTATAYANTGIGEATRTTDPGVVIDGIRWATRNVDMPGTFAPRPESPGMFYQWNRRRAWATIDEVSDWNTSIPQGEVWERANDPCPQGWRVPTRSEFATLRNRNNINSRWTELNEVNGRIFEDRTSGNTLFLPVTAYRNNNGVPNYASALGLYWSNTPAAGTNAWLLSFDNRSVSVGRSSRALGFSVRCVAE